MPPNASNKTSTSNLGVLHSGNKIHKPELVKKIGGTDVLKQAVNNFYDRLTVDPEIRVFFEGADLEVLRWHQFNRKFDLRLRTGLFCRWKRNHVPPLSILCRDRKELAFVVGILLIILSFLTFCFQLNPRHTLIAFTTQSCRLCVHQ